MWCVTIADERGIIVWVSPRFGETFFTTEEFHAMMKQARLLALLLFGW